MLTETARVVAVEAGSLWVETIRKSVCGSCAASKGCGHGIVSRISDGQRNYLRVSSASYPDRFQVDDEVRIAIPEQLLLRSSFVVYVVPLLSTLLLAALMAGLLPAATDFDVALGAGLGFLLGVGLVRLHAWKNRDNVLLQPRLLGPAAATLS
ncbi:MAG: SoxR reducing system RseC family protein [Halieaceae bacterium]